jgi:hypothetical protein
LMRTEHRYRIGTGGYSDLLPLAAAVRLGA